MRYYQGVDVMDALGFNSQTKWEAFMFAAALLVALIVIYIVLAQFRLSYLTRASNPAAQKNSRTQTQEGLGKDNGQRSSQILRIMEWGANLNREEHDGPPSRKRGSKPGVFVDPKALLVSERRASLSHLPNLSGKWIMFESDDDAMDAVLKASGIPWLKRKVAVYLDPVWTIQQDGSFLPHVGACLTMRPRNVGNHFKIKFETTLMKNVQEFEVFDTDKTCIWAFV